jgi:hypothetical protein
MSRGRRTQVKLNILTALTLAGAIAFGFCMVILHALYHPVTLSLFGSVVVLGLIGVAAHRCPRCGHDVTKDAEGVRTHKSWPKVNETCAQCGAEIP